MRLPEILLIAVALAIDAFAVSLASGASGRVRDLRGAIRLSFHFGLFQALMPILGWFAGTRIAPLITEVDHWVAFGLLALVGGRMIRSGWRPGEAEARRGDPSRGLTLVALSLATSIDALAVGLSLAMIGVSIWYPSAIIGAVTAALSIAGTQLGGRLGAMFGKGMEVVGGLVLILIGLRILLSHLAE